MRHLLVGATTLEGVKTGIGISDSGLEADRPIESITLIGGLRMPEMDETEESIALQGVATTQTSV